MWPHEKLLPPPVAGCEIARDLTGRIRSSLCDVLHQILNLWPVLGASGLLHLGTMAPINPQVSRTSDANMEIESCAMPLW